VRDEVLTSSQLRNPIQCDVGRFVSELGEIVCIEPNDGISTAEIATIGTNHASTSSDEYLFVAHRPESDLFLNPEENTGINLYRLPFQSIFTENMVNASLTDHVTNPREDPRDLQRSPYRTGLAFTAAATEMHEIGHSLNLGEADDGPPQGDLFNNYEVYSGNDGQAGLTEDNTPENLRRGSSEEWSIMAQTTQTLTIRPMNGRYFVFSLEELSTVEDQ